MSHFHCLTAYFKRQLVFKQDDLNLHHKADSKFPVDPQTRGTGTPNGPPSSRNILGVTSVPVNQRTRKADKLAVTTVEKSFGNAKATGNVLS
jgi:hypothetical protein